MKNKKWKVWSISIVVVIAIVLIGGVLLLRHTRDLSTGKWGSVKYTYKNRVLTLKSSGQLGDKNQQPTLAKKARTVIFKPGIKVTAPEDASDLFSGFSFLKEIKGLKQLNTSKTIDMSEMFLQDQCLKNIDTTSFNTKHVKNMKTMFGGDASLIALNLKSFDTSKVKNMSNIFSGDFNLRNINLSSFNTTKVKKMDSMFYQNTSLRNLDISNFKLNHVKKMKSMFAMDVALSQLVLPSLNAPKVKEKGAAKMFWADYNLKSINIVGNTMKPNHSIEKMIKQAKKDSKVLN